MAPWTIPFATLRYSCLVIVSRARVQQHFYREVGARGLFLLFPRCNCAEENGVICLRKGLLIKDVMHGRENFKRKSKNIIRCNELRTCIRLGLLPFVFLIRLRCYITLANFLHGRPINRRHLLFYEVLKSIFSGNRGPHF